MQKIRTVAVALVALVALVATGVALAATNSYTATITASQSGPGTAKKPVALGMVQKLGATPPAGQANANPLTDIRLTLPKVTFNQTGFPVCSASTISTAGNDSGCPKGALVGTGPVSATLWSPASPQTPGQPCDPVLDIWNAGHGTLTYFFKIPPGHTCVGLQTGSVAPWTGTLKEVGGSLIDDTPLPPPVSTNAGNIGLYSSLNSETLTFAKLTHKSKGKVVPFFGSTGCVAGKRPYSVAFTSTDGKTSSTSTVTGSAGC